jgi:hypothetical protein
MGLPWYRVHTVVLNDPGRLLAVHLMHTALVSGWAGSMALYELAIYDPSDPVLNPMWRQGMFVMPFMARLGVTDSWGGWSITGESVSDPGLWSFEGVALAHIVLSGLLFLAAVWHWTYWDLELFIDPRTGEPALDLPKIFGRSSAGSPVRGSLNSSRSQYTQCQIAARKHIPDNTICVNATPSKLQIPGFETLSPVILHPPQESVIPRRAMKGITNIP